MYHDYVILLESKGIIKTFEYDKLLMKYLKNGDINYIVVYNDFTIEKRKNDINNYKKYLIKEFILDLWKNL